MEIVWEYVRIVEAYADHNAEHHVLKVAVRVAMDVV